MYSFQENAYSSPERLARGKVRERGSVGFSFVHDKIPDGDKLGELNRGQVLPYTHTHTHALINTHSHTLLNTFTYACTHSHIHVNTQYHKHFYTFAYTRTHTHTHA